MEKAQPFPSLHDGEISTIKIDTASIPDRVRDDLAAATLESFLAYIRQPGNREKLEARIAAKKAAQADNNRMGSK